MSLLLNIFKLFYIMNLNSVDSSKAKKLAIGAVGIFTIYWISSLLQEYMYLLNDEGLNKSTIMWSQIKKNNFQILSF